MEGADAGIALGVPAAVAEIEAAIFLPRWMMLGPDIKGRVGGKKGARGAFFGSWTLSFSSPDSAVEVRSWQSSVSG